ncbi:MAG: type I restriction-modification enzyme R subunit C-terminal domain-containing protein [Cyclobacteriaceae bacterium]|nr:type I restriction-modification enzyme R subunit C-terminal domain-containing protein [Cyclobacteriaceae bacterium]
MDYFGNPIYTYSLKQGIDDGFLAPYKVIKVTLDRDAEGWRPEEGKRDTTGLLVEDRMYNTKDFDRNLVIKERTERVAKKVSEFLRATNRMDKTIIFCVDIDHAERMREAIANENRDLYAQNTKYVMKITGDDELGKNELDNFTNPEEPYPVIATTSKLMTTGVDAQTCKLIVLDSNIASMTEFKQIIGRGTRIREDFGKLFFTIMDFRNVTALFADPDFDGDPVQIYAPGSDDPVMPEDDGNEEIIVDNETGEEILIDPPGVEGGGNIVDGPARKVYVNNVEVVVVNERVQYYDHGTGRLITERLTDYTKKTVQQQYHSLDEFLTRWTNAGKKTAIIEELEEQGIFFENLQEQVGKNLDPFDLICHIVFEQPPLTRKERADNVKKRNYFTKYSEQAARVLNALLDKYADEGIENIESNKILSLQPISEFGTPAEIVGFFGGVDQFKKAIQELEDKLYIAA